MGNQRTNQASIADAKQAGPALPRSPVPHTLRGPLLELQQAIGNRAVGRFLAERSDAEQPTREPAAPQITPALPLLVDDLEEDVSSRQMRKSQFLSALREAVCGTADEAMAGTGRTSESCPWIDYWFEVYARKDASHVERAIRKFAPQAAAAQTARDYIPVVAARVRGSVIQWASTGEISGLPEGVPMDLPGQGPMESLLLKSRRTGSADADPQTVRFQLGEGRALDGGARKRMEAAFGMSFSHVRLHVDAAAADLASRLDARAFAVGQHVAFASGEYQPGTPVGDALIAHELAHVAQQNGSVDSHAPRRKGYAEYDTLERDADVSATRAVLSLWGRADGVLGAAASSAMPRLTSGLRLQRCGPAHTPARRPATGALPEESACPRVVSMAARVRDATVSDSCGRACQLETGCCPTPRGECGNTAASGTAITATIEAPSGCRGELAFAQNTVSVDRRRTLTGGTHECIMATTAHSDGGRPWKGCTLPVTGRGAFTIRTDDCPNIKLRDNMTAASVNETFKTFLLWKPEGEEARRAIANVTWGWTASTTRRSGAGCASWSAPRASHTDGDGSASSDQPATSPRIQDRDWEPCE